MSRIVIYDISIGGLIGRYVGCGSALILNLWNFVFSLHLDFMDVSQVVVKVSLQIGSVSAYLTGKGLHMLKCNGECLKY